MPSVNRYQIRSRFVRNWDRVARFAQEDVGYAREFAERGEQAPLKSAAGSCQPSIPGIPIPTRLDEEGLRRIAGESSGAIRLTLPQGSLEPPGKLLVNMSETFPKEPKGKPRRFRDRQQAALLAVRTVLHAVEQRFRTTTARTVVRGAYPIGGRVVPRLKVDLAVTNGRVYVANRALSLETDDMPELERQIRDGVYTLRDVGELLGRVRLDMPVLPPDKVLRRYRQVEERFRETLTACRAIDARVVFEADAPAWAEEIADLVATEIVRPRGFAQG